MKIGDIVVVVDTGYPQEIIRIEPDGTRIMKQLPRDTKIDRDAAYYCNSSMLRPVRPE